MPFRELPARPDLEHLKHEAKALRKAFAAGDAGAVARGTAVLGAKAELKLTEAQRVVAREYGFPSWARLRAHVQATRSVEEAVHAFLEAVANGDRDGAARVLQVEPNIGTTSVHAAAVLGLDHEVRRLLAADPARVHERAGRLEGTPLLWLCYSPFHGAGAERDAGLEAAARTLLDAGADPNARDAQYGVPALFAVTGVNNAPRIARMLLDAGAEVNDGESAFHAAERYHVEALELLLSYGVDLNHVGDWGNTPLYFLLRYWDVARMPSVQQGMHWLLEHGADPDVRCTREQETSLHVAVRRRQRPDVVRTLLQHGADVNAQRADGRTPLDLALRAGADELVALLQAAGAQPHVQAPTDALLAACGRGDAATARALASPELIAALDPAELRLLPDAAANGRLDMVQACLAAGFDVDTTDEQGATALHHAAFHGRADIVRELLAAGADHTIHDTEHHGSPIGWACFAADHMPDTTGDYPATVRTLLEYGARLDPRNAEPSAPALRELLRQYV